MEGERTVEMLLDADYVERDPALSPDGRWLAYFSGETGTPRIYVRPLPNIDDGQWRVSTDLGRAQPNKTGRFRKVMIVLDRLGVGAVVTNW